VKAARWDFDFADATYGDAYGMLIVCTALSLLRDKGVPEFGRLLAYL